MVLVVDKMGNKCLSPCPSTPLTDVKTRFRCSYFCCLKGATINVIHTNNIDPEGNDELDGDNDKDQSVHNFEVDKVVFHKDGIYGKRDSSETAI